jgi:type I restriction enzyme S subunit
VTGYPTYSKYKDSGVAWLGEIPAHWTVQKLKHISLVSYSNVDKHKKEEEHPVHLCNYVDVYYNDYITTDLDLMEATASPDEILKYSLKAGDIIITKDSETWDDIAVPAYVPSELEGVLCGYHLALIHPEQEVGDKYLFHSFLARGISHQFRRAATGITRYGLGKHWLENALFPVPPRPEQRAIAAFLDRETAKLDALTHACERLLDVLEERRAALISHAVTQGLDPDVAMQDSGSPWLGEIPMNWEVSRVKWVTSHIGSGKTPRGGSKIYKNSGVMFLRSQNVHFEGLELEDVVYIGESIDYEMKSTRVLPEDILLNITGASLGRCCIVPPSFPRANVNQHVCILRPVAEKIDASFFHKTISSSSIQSQIFALENGSSREGINFSQIGDLVFAKPKDLTEQRAIAAHLDRETAKLDALAAKVRVAIERLAEYRSALISAAVTGKIDVRSAP